MTTNQMKTQRDAYKDCIKMLEKAIKKDSNNVDKYEKTLEFMKVQLQHAETTLQAFEVNEDAPKTTTIKKETPKEEPKEEFENISIDDLF